MEKLHASYENKKPLAQRFAERLKEQVEEVLFKQRISLAVPVEIRVKEWDSIKSKIERKKLNLIDVSELDDFIGARIILLFKRDAQRVCDLIASTFKVIGSEDTQQRLGVSQFGYQSTHFQVVLPEEWLRIPTFKDFGGFSVELQVRTAAQHIWAAASHVLQYKHERAVPQPVLRSINRVSALLETVDLEFERALQERQEYRSAPEVDEESAPLNVENLRAIINSFLPKENRSDSEPYDEILSELNKEAGLKTVGDLQKLLTEHSAKAVAFDNERVDALRSKGKRDDSGNIEVYHKGTFCHSEQERIDRGVFKSHVGLVRDILEQLKKPKKAM